MADVVVTRRSITAVLSETFEGRTVLVTGHTGFVGGWLSFLLHEAGARVVGLALPAEPGSVASRLDLAGLFESRVVDVNDRYAVAGVIEETAPEIVFHLAAQALVLQGYDEPIETFATNVLGTAHVLDALRSSAARACVVVTSDKCYAELGRPHLEGDALGGEDPYSASKAAAEIVTHAYRTSYGPSMPALATARAGNIIGGGDVCADRLIPDLARAIVAGSPLQIRRPEATRPWQHVLDAVAGYLRLADALVVEGREIEGEWNFGPPEGEASSVLDLASGVLERWRSIDHTISTTIEVIRAAVAERTYLALDSTRARTRLGWSSLLDADEIAGWTAEWYEAVWRRSPGSARSVTSGQIAEFLDRDLHSLEADSPPRPPQSTARATRV